MINLEENTKKLIEACQNGQLEEIKLLLSVSNPKWNDSEPLCSVSEKGHTDIVKLLIPVSDPKSNDSEALCCLSCHCKNQEIFDVLYPVSEPKKALKWIILKNKKDISGTLIYWKNA